MPMAACRSRRQAPEKFTASPRRRDSPARIVGFNKPGARLISRRNRFTMAAFSNRDFAAPCLEAIDVHIAARSAASRRYSEGRRLRASADRLWTRIQSAMGLLPRRFRRVLDLRQYSNPCPEEHHHGPHIRLASSGKIIACCRRIIRRIGLSKDVDRIAGPQLTSGEGRIGVEREIENRERANGVKGKGWDTV